jgi:hypothetical protein
MLPGDTGAMESALLTTPPALIDGWFGVDELAETVKLTG